MSGGRLRRGSSLALAVMMGLTTLTMVLGAGLKSPCADRSWVEERRGASGQCYSDIADLLRTEQLADGRLPYLERCDVAAKPCDEYPLVSMYVMRLTASWPGGGDPYTTFFWVNVVLLLACALVITWCLERLGAATALFAVAPTLLIYGTMNWDLVPVAFATVATFAFLKRREVASGVLLGIGAAAKLYPALLVLPFAADRWRTDERGRGVKLVLAAAISWLALNLPFALAAPEGWFHFVRYHSERPAEYDSLWRVACENGLCLTTGAINIASLILFAVGSAFVWRVKERRDPEVPAWTFGFVLVAMFLLTNKVWSPQYALWLLPWFALVAPSFKPYLAFQAAEVLVFVARFSFFQHLEGDGGLPYAVLEIAVAARALALVWCLAAWVRAADYSVAPTVTSPDWAARRIAAKRLPTPNLP